MNSSWNKLLYKNNRIDTAGELTWIFVTDVNTQLVWAEKIIKLLCWLGVNEYQYWSTKSSPRKKTLLSRSALSETDEISH